MSKFKLFITAQLVIATGVVNFSSCKYNSNDIEQPPQTVYAPPVVQPLKLSKVTVTITAGKGPVTIQVKDSGTGIPDAIKDKIMQPFFTIKPTGGGTGLGLSLTYDMIVKGHGGSINVNSTEGEVSEFIISLPLS